MALSILLLKQTMAIHIKTHRNMDTGETFLTAYEETTGLVSWHLPHKPGDQELHPRTQEKVEGGNHLCKVVLCPPHAHCVNDSHTHWKCILFKRRGKCSSQPKSWYSGWGDSAFILRLGRQWYSHSAFVFSIVLTSLTSAVSQGMKPKDSVVITFLLL